MQLSENARKGYESRVSKPRSEKNQGRLYSALEDMATMVEHALELGYLGRGSTRGWAKSSLKEAEDALEECNAR